MLCEQAHEIAEVLVTHVDHWCDCKVFAPQLVIDHVFARICLWRYSLTRSIILISVVSVDFS